MGNLWSTAPWREDYDVFSRKRKDGLIDEIKKLATPGECRTVNLIVIGLMGSGKSSLVNTFKTVSRNSGQICTIAVSHPKYRPNTTKKLFEVPLMDLSNGAEVHIFDYSGISRENNDASYSQSVEDNIMMAIDGHIKAGYKFQKNKIQKNDEFYRENPTISDKMHCILFVVDGDQDLKQNESEYKSLLRLQSRLEDKNIPIRLILTRADKPSVCGSYGLDYIFTNSKALEKVETAKKVFAFQDCQVHPIANYVSGTHQNITQDVLALLAMNNIIQEAILYIENIYHS